MQAMPVLKFSGGRYVLEEFIGTGSLGEVYRAVDRLTGRPVALKRILTLPDRLVFHLRDSEADPYLALAREFHTWAALCHAQLASVLDYGFDATRQPYLAVAWLDEAHTILNAAELLDFRGRVQLLLQTLEALAYLHRHGIFHRNMKPSNILVGTAQQIQVVDYGVSLKLEKNVEIADSLRYLAPEVIDGGPIGVTTDLYAVGVIGYEMFAGRHPFNIRNKMILLKEIRQNEPDLMRLVPERATPRADDAEWAAADQMTSSPNGRNALESTNERAGDRLRAIIGKLLQKEPDRRYTSAEAVLDDLRELAELPARRGTPSLHSNLFPIAKFVGRDVEMKVLNSVLATAINGRGSAWMVGGDSGTGKSRLLEELRLQALLRGVLILHGETLADGALPYQVWRNPARRLALSVDLSDLEAGVLRELVPDIETILKRPCPEAPKLDAAANRERLIVTLVAVFCRQKLPIVLLLEDLHRAEHSLDVLKALLRHVNSLPLLIVGSYQGDLYPELPAELPEMQLLKLSRLTATQIQELAVALVGAQGQQTHLLGFLQQETRGNTILLVEILRELTGESNGLDEPSVTRLLTEIGTGDILQQIVRRRLSRLAPKDQHLLKLAAVGGRYLDRRVLHAAVPEADLKSWIMLCADTALLEVREGQGRFVHDTLRLNLLSLLEEGELQRFHRQIGEAIVHVYPAADEWSVNVMEHWRAANTLEEEARWAVKATHYAAEWGVPTDVLKYGKRAQLLIDEVDIGANKIALLKWLADAHQRLGQLGQAMHHYEESLAFALAANDLAGSADALLGLGSVYMLQGDLVTAQTHFEKGRDFARRARAMLSVADSTDRLGELAFQYGELNAAHTFFMESLAILRPTQKVARLATSLNNMGNVLFRQGKFGEARVYLEESMALATQTGNLSGCATSLSTLGEIAFRQEEMTRARGYFEDSLNALGDTSQVYLTAFNLVYLGCIHLHEKDLFLAREKVRRALRLAQQAGLLPVLLFGLAAYAWYFFLYGDIKTGVQLIGLVEKHATTDASLRDFLQRLYHRFEPVLTHDLIARDKMRGSARDLSETVEQILGAGLH